MNYVGSPVFKGLQRPLEFMGIRGRFLTFAAKLAGFMAMIIMAITGLLTIYVKQRGGLHNKKRYKGVFVYRELYVH